MKKIDAGIVLYNPDISKLEANIKSISPQVDNIILFDNGSTNEEQIQQKIKLYSRVIYLRSDKNLGIAIALNRIFRYAITNLQAEYVLTLDQDSFSPSDLIETYLSYYSQNVAIYTPLIKDINANKVLESSKNNTDEVNECITSASLTSCEAWSKVNGFDETMFIDCVDFDFCIRLRKKGYKILRINSVCLSHEIGHINEHNFLFKKIYVKNHKPFRKFYIARNTIYVARKSRNKFEILKSLLKVLKQIMLVVFFEQDKLKKVNSLMNGMKDGLLVNIDDRWR